MKFPFILCGTIAIVIVGLNFNVIEHLKINEFKKVGAGAV
jgi:hypothetical protein